MFTPRKWMNMSESLLVVSDDLTTNSERVLSDAVLLVCRNESGDNQSLDQRSNLPRDDDEENAPKTSIKSHRPASTIEEKERDENKKRV